MNKFCENCHNLLYPSFTNEEAIFKCMSCQETYPYTDIDTLRYSKTKDNNIDSFENILNKAGADPAGLKKRIKCVKCPNNIVKQVILSEKMKLFNICTKCDTKWLN